MTDKKDIDLNNIPDELKKIPNWLFHIDKQPMTWNPEKQALRSASIKDPSQWLTFEKLKELKKIVDKKYADLEKRIGVGFVFKPELGYIFIDFDHVRDDQGNVNPEVEQIIEKLDSYTEISLSGHGLHTYVRSHIPEYAKGHAKKMQKEYGNLEVYEEKFCVITGNVYKQYNKIREIEYYEIFDILGIEINGEIETEKGNINEISKDQIDQLYAILDQYAIEGYRNSVQLTISVLLKNAGLSKEFVDQFYIDYIRTRGTDGKMSEDKIIYEITYLNNYIFVKDYPKIASKKDLPPGFSVKDVKKIIWKGVKKDAISDVNQLNNEDQVDINALDEGKGEFQEELKKIFKDVKEKEKHNIAPYLRARLNDHWYYTIEKENGLRTFIEFDDFGNIYNTDVPSIQTTDDDGNPIIFIPAPQIQERRFDAFANLNKDLKTVKFPGDPSPIQNPYELYLEIKKFIHKFVEIPEEYETILSVYVLMASVFDLVDSFSIPFVHIIAPWGHGKTRILTVLNFMTPYSIYFDSPKAPAIKRIAELYNAVLYIDEVKKMDDDLESLLNARFNINGTYINANKEIQKGFNGIIAYSIAGPTVIGSRKEFEDTAIESRAFKINLRNTELEREDIPRSLSGNIAVEFRKEAEEIRNKLMFFKIKYFKEINEKIGNIPDWLKRYEKVAEPRLYELLISLSGILNVIPELQADVSKIIDNQIIESVEIARETPEGVVIKIFLDILMDDIKKSEENNENEKKRGGDIPVINTYEYNAKEYKGILLEAIYDEAGKNYSSIVGRVLSENGIAKDRPRITYQVLNDAGEPVKDKNGNEIVKKKRVSYARIPEPKRILSLLKRYDINYIKLILDLMKVGITEDLNSLDPEKIKRFFLTLDKFEKEEIQSNTDFPIDILEGWDRLDNLSHGKSILDYKEIKKEIREKIENFLYIMKYIYPKTFQKLLSKFLSYINNNLKFDKNKAIKERIEDIMDALYSFPMVQPVQPVQPVQDLSKVSSKYNPANTLEGPNSEKTPSNEVKQTISENASENKEKHEENKDILLTDKMRFFKVDQYYEPEKMDAWGIKVIDYFNYNGFNYYAIDDQNEIKGSGAYEYSNFVLRVEREGSKISREEFLKIKEEFLKNKEGKNDP